MHLSPEFTSAICSFVYSAICTTLRIKEEGRQAVDDIDRLNERMICCLWHDELFSLIPVARQLKVAAIVSPSRDGDMLTRILASKNVGAVRGSSRRGGMNALLAMTHLMQKEQVHAVITMDGPAGPLHKVKNGALFLANYTNAHILPVRIYHRCALKLPTWDSFQIPLPFSSALIRFGKPWEAGKLAVPDLEEQTLASARHRLEQDMAALEINAKGMNP